MPYDPTAQPFNYHSKIDSSRAAILEFGDRLREIYANLLFTACLTARTKQGKLINSKGAGYVAYKQGRVIYVMKVAGGWLMCYVTGTFKPVLRKHTVATIKVAQQIIDGLEDLTL